MDSRWAERKGLDRQSVTALPSDDAAYLRRRYVDDGRSVREIAEENDVSVYHVEKALDRAGIERRRRGFRFHHERPRGITLTSLEDRRPAGFQSWHAYFSARRRSNGAPRLGEIAEELGVSRWTAGRLVSELEGVQPHYRRRPTPQDAG